MGFDLGIYMTTGYIDFRGIVCDESKLKTYMFFPKSANITSVSKELCSIPDSSISGITDLILQQLDVAAIFRVVNFHQVNKDFIPWIHTYINRKL
jgi:hypothetical protein